MAQILKLDVAGQPEKWISWEDAVFYYVKGLVGWELGAENERVVRGGTNAKTGERSQITAAPIISVRGEAKKRKARIPTLSNDTLFARDFNTCAYCGGVFNSNRLTRDHVMPSSRGGKDAWSNVVTACHYCNQKKDDKTPDEAGMPLMFQPYTPTRAEYMLLQNRGAMPVQMKFLLDMVPDHSRLKSKMMTNKIDTRGRPLDLAA